MDWLLGCSLCGCFVGTFYVWPCEQRFIVCAVKNLRKAALDSTVYLDRDASTTIKRRSLSFLLATCASAMYLIQSSPSTFTGIDYTGVLCAAGLTVALFSGPIAESVFTTSRDVLEVSRGDAPMIVRNLFLCPAGEEIFFRGVLFHIFRHRPAWAQVVLSATLFAASHTHHAASWAVEEYRYSCDAEPGSDTAEPAADPLVTDSWHSALRKLRIVYSYTFTFGLLSGYYYLRVCSRSILSISVTHAICNAIGPPQFIFLRKGRLSAKQRAISGALYIAGVGVWVAASLHH